MARPAAAGVGLPPLPRTLPLPQRPPAPGPADRAAGRPGDDLRLYGQPVLRRVALEVDDLDARYVALCETMVAVMRRHRGLAVAAPQVGVSRRLYLWAEDDGPHVVINPVLAEADGEQVGDEGCLSMPGVTLQIRRPARVLLGGLTLAGEPFERELDGLAARVACHEVDHLDGVLTLDRAGRQQRRDAERKLAARGLGGC